MVNTQPSLTYAFSDPVRQIFIFETIILGINKKINGLFQTKCLTTYSHDILV